MSHLQALILFSVRAFLLLLGALVLVRLLTGSISMRGLLKDRETGGVSALRVQMLIATVVAAASYGAAIARHGSAGFPVVDGRLLVLVSGSNGLLIAQRTFAKLAKFLRATTQP